VSDEGQIIGRTALHTSDIFLECLGWHKENYNIGAYENIVQSSCWRGAKERGTPGLVKGLGKGFLGLIGRPAIGVADLTSTSFKLIKQ
jgi:hypothetical protein